jgi:hypothetical protein
MKSRSDLKNAEVGLARVVLTAANVSSGNCDPSSSDISLSINRLEADTGFPIALIRSIQELRQTAITAFNQSKFVYDPSVDQARDYAHRCVELGNELVKGAR